MTTSIDYIAALGYRDGVDTITVGTDRVALLVETWDRIGCAREANPDAFPGAVWADLSIAAVARKVLGSLLDAGWTPPGPDAIAAAVAQLDERTGT